MSKVTRVSTVQCGTALGLWSGHEEECCKMLCGSWQQRNTTTGLDTQEPGARENSFSWSSEWKHGFYAYALMLSYYTISRSFLSSSHSGCLGHPVISTLSRTRTNKLTNWKQIYLHACLASQTNEVHLVNVLNVFFRTGSLLLCHYDLTLFSQFHFQHVLGLGPQQRKASKKSALL